MPQTHKKIGFIAELVLEDRILGSYGFRAIESHEDEVLFLPLDRTVRRTLPATYGADRLRWRSSTRGFQELDVKAEVLEHEIDPQLRSMVAGGHLNEESNPDLLSEGIISLMEEHPKIFAPLMDGWRRPRAKYPVTLSEVESCYRRELLRRHFQEELAEARRRSGEASWMSDRGVISYGVRISAEDRSWIEERVGQAIAAGEDIEPRVRYVHLEKLGSQLEVALNGLRETPVLVSPVLPLQDTIARIETWDSEAFSVFTSHAHQLLAKWLDNSRSLLRCNFQSLLPAIDQSAIDPVCLFVACDVDTLASNGAMWIYVCEQPHGCSIDKIEFVSPKDLTVNGFDLESPHGHRRCLRIEGISIDSFVTNRTRSSRHKGLLRSWVYWSVRHTLKEFRKALFDYYG